VSSRFEWNYSQLVNFINVDSHLVIFDDIAWDVQTTHSCCLMNNVVRRGVYKCHNIGGSRVKSSKVLVLDGFCVTEIHLEGVSSPAETFLDEGRGHACLVKQNTSPDTEGVGGVFLEVVSQSRWSYFCYCFTKECSNPAAGDK
jgi:hypothetical protein